MIDHPVFEISNTYTYDLQKFDTRLNKVKISIAKDNIRPLFTGVHLNNNAMVTVDGWRISMNTDNDLNIIEPITVPFSKLSLMQKLYGTKDKHTLTIKTNHIYTTFEFNNVTFTTRLLEGDFPKYEQLLNADLKNEVTADTEQLKENVKYICDMKENGSRLPMKTIFDNGKVTFNYDCEKGSYSTSMQLDNKYEFKIAFNPDFVDDALTSIGKSKNVTLLLPDKNVNPMLIVNEEQTEKYLILPIIWNE